MTVKTAKKAAAVKTPEPIANRFRGKCVDCGNWVGAAEGVATPPSKKGEKWTVHHGHIADNGSAVIGPCPKPATVKSRQNNNTKENAMPVRRTRKPAPAPKKIETFSAEDIAALSLRELRDLAKELGLDEQVKKIGILNELIAKGHLIDDDSEESTPAPAKKTTARKRVAPAKEADEDESASDDDGADDLDAALAGMLETIKGQIASGALDVILGGIEDAISDRLDAVAAETKPVKRAAKKTTTPARSKSEKMAPVKRTAPKSEETTEDGGLEVGKIYTIGGKSKLTGARGKFTGYKDDEQTRALIVLTKAHGDYQRGHKVSLPAKSINV